MSSRKMENFDAKFSDYVNDFKKYRQAMSTNANYDDRRSQAGKSENANNDNEMKTTSGRYPSPMPHYNNPYSYPLPQQQQQIERDARLLGEHKFWCLRSLRPQVYQMSRAIWWPKARVRKKQQLIFLYFVFVFLYLIWIKKKKLWRPRVAASWSHNFW